jgi:xanthine dehydrogenase accessory factor
MMKQPSPGTIDYAEHALDILAYAAGLMAKGQPYALVASLAIEGGAARAVGSLAVVSAEGRMKGYMSNGCIDHDIIQQAMLALESGQVRHLRYGEGSPFWDLKLPCGGALEIVIDPKPAPQCLEVALVALRSRQTAHLSFSSERGVVPAQEGEVHFSYAPKPALVLAGRGAILRMCAQFGALMDFDLHIASPDQEDLDQIAACAEGQIYRMYRPDQAIDLPLDHHSAFLLLFHDHEWEQSLLLSLAGLRPFFIGALGSRKTHALRCLALREQGLEDQLINQISGPVGLVPSLRNASLIAVSALAEITAALPTSVTVVRRA